MAVYTKVYSSKTTGTGGYCTSLILAFHVFSILFPFSILFICVYLQKLVIFSLHSSHFQLGYFDGVTSSHRFLVFCVQTSSISYQNRKLLLCPEPRLLYFHHVLFGENLVCWCLVKSYGGGMLPPSIMSWIFLLRWSNPRWNGWLTDNISNILDFRLTCRASYLL